MTSIVESKTQEILDELLKVISKHDDVIKKQPGGSRLPIHMAVLNLAQELIKTEVGGDYDYKIHEVSPTHLTKKLVDNAMKSILYLNDYHMYYSRKLLEKEDKKQMNEKEKHGESPDSELDFIYTSTLPLRHMDDDEKKTFNALMTQTPKMNPHRKAHMATKRGRPSVGGVSLKRLTTSIDNLVKKCGLDEEKYKDGSYDGLTEELKSISFEPSDEDKQKLSNAEKAENTKLREFTNEKNVYKETNTVLDESLDEGFTTHMKSHKTAYTKAKNCLQKVKDTIENDKNTKERNVKNLTKKLEDYKLNKKGLVSDDQELINKKKLCKLANDVGLVLNMMFDGHKSREDHVNKLKLVDDSGDCLETGDLMKLSDESLFDEFEYLKKEKYIGKKYRKLPMNHDKSKYAKLERWNLNTQLYHYKSQLERKVRITLNYDMKSDNPCTHVCFKNDDVCEHYIHVKSTYETHQSTKKKKLAEIKELVENLYPETTRPAKKARESLGGALEPVAEEVDMNLETQPF